jgi:hypothetical protein
MSPLSIIVRFLVRPGENTLSTFKVLIKGAFVNSSVSKNLGADSFSEGTIPLSGIF